LFLVGALTGLLLALLLEGALPELLLPLFLEDLTGLLLRLLFTTLTGLLLTVRDDFLDEVLGGVWLRFLRGGDVMGLLLMLLPLLPLTGGLLLAPFTGLLLVLLLLRETGIGLLSTLELLLTLFLGLGLKSLFGLILMLLLIVLLGVTLQLLEEFLGRSSTTLV